MTHAPVVPKVALAASSSSPVSAVSDEDGDDAETKLGAPADRNEIVVGWENPVTGKFRPRYLVLQFRPQIKWLDSHPGRTGPHRFQLQISLPRPYHPHLSEMYTLYDSEHDHGACQLLVPREIPHNIPLIVHVFLWRWNTYNQLCQYDGGQTSQITVGDLFYASQNLTRKQIALRNMDARTKSVAVPASVSSPSAATSAASTGAEKKNSGKTYLLILKQTTVTDRPGEGEEEEDEADEPANQPTPGENEKNITFMDQRFGLKQPKNGVRAFLYSVQMTVQAEIEFAQVEILPKNQTFTLTDPLPKYMSPKVPMPSTMGLQYTTGGLVPSSLVAKVFRRTHIYFLDGIRMWVWIWCMLPDNSRWVEPVPDTLLDHAAQHAARWFGFKTTEEWIASSDRSDAGFEVLAQVMGFVPWQCPYLYDKTLDPKAGKLVVYDEFSVLRRKPNAAAWAGDCEDFSKEMQLMKLALMRRHNDPTYKPTPAIRALLNLARGYCCFIVDSSIHNKSQKISADPLRDDPDQVSLHMYVMMIPWNKVARLLNNTGNEAIVQRFDPETQTEIKRTEKWPVLSLESTEIAIGNWNLKMPHIDELVREMPRFVKGIATRKDAWLKAKVHTSGDYFRRDGFYRMDIACYSQELWTQTAVHTLLFTRRPANSSVPWKFGAPKVEVLDYLNKGAELKSGIEIGLFPVGGSPVTHRADVELVRAIYDRLPAIPPFHWTDPWLCEQSQQYHHDSKVVRVFTRKFEWDPIIQAAFEQSIRDNAKYEILGFPQPIGIVDGHTILMYELRRSDG